ncbi:MAG: DUF5011 domain-containing protein [Proteobacteria bacterium]|nr:DUF5011 domain-containing protein [Pseudomonadota bacterium]
MLGSLSNVVGMAGGNNHGLALLREGTVRAWGTNNNGQTNVPTNLVTTNATNFVKAVAVTAAQDFSLALLANGRVQMWGANSYVSAGSFSAITNAVGLAAGSDFVLSLLADGSVRYTGNVGGSGGNGRSQVPFALTNAAAVATNPAVAIAAGVAHGLAIRRDGSVVAWGDTTAALNLGTRTNAAAVAGGNLHSLVLLRDGTVVASANNANTNVPTGQVGAVPQGGPDSDGDGWSNEAELRAGSHPLNAQSYPAKVVLAGGSTNGVVVENGSLVVGTLQARDRMGWIDSLENLGGVRVLGTDGAKFEVVGQSLRLKAAVDYEGLSQLQGTANPQFKVTLEVQGLAQELTVAIGNDPSDDDTVPPVITLLGDNPLVVGWLGTYSDPGARVTDNVDAERTMLGTGTVNTARPGNYTVVYQTADQAGNRATNTRTVAVRLAVRAPGSPPPADGIDEVVKYALQGGETGEVTSSNLPQSTPVPGNKLRITAVVRTNDPNLTVEAWASGSLLGPWTNLGTGMGSANQTGVDRSQYQRREYEAGGPDQPTVFLRLKYSHALP